MPRPGRSAKASRIGCAGGVGVSSCISWRGLPPASFRDDRHHDTDDDSHAGAFDLAVFEVARGLIPFVEYVLVRVNRSRACPRSNLHQTTTLTPEQYIAGLTNFGPGRSKLFGNSADEYLKVHRKGATEAYVTEGSGGIWEQPHYDWSDPHRVILKTTDSNPWGGASGHTYTFTRHPQRDNRY